MSPKKADDSPEALKRESAGRYRTADARFSVEQDSGRWMVVDEEQTDELGLPRVRGPYSTLDQVKAAIAEARSEPAAPSPLEARIREAAKRPKGAAAKGSPAASRKPAKELAESAPSPIQVRALGADDERLLKRLSELAAKFDVHLGLEVDGRLRSLGPGEAGRFLERADARLLVATEDDAPVGFALIGELPRRAGEPIVLVLHELGIRADRQEEIGLALAAAIRKVATDRAVRRVHAVVTERDAEKLALLRTLGRRHGTGETVVRFDLPD